MWLRQPTVTSIDSSLYTDVSLIVKDVFGYLVEEIVGRDLLDDTFQIDSTDVHADSRDEEASWNYDPTAETDDDDTDHGEDPEQDTTEAEQDDENSGGYYYGYGCLMVTTGPKLPAAAAFTEQKQVDTPTARRVTQDALTVGKPTSMLGDGAFDMLAWHDDLIEEGVVPIAPYNQRNADDPYDIEQRITEHSYTVRLWPKQLKETYKKRSQVERTIGA